MSMIDQYRPTIYLELHSYSNYSSLTDQDRIEKKGVPPLIDLGSGMLLGSVSPLLRTKFRKEDLCLLLDIPKETEREEEILEIMEIIARGTNRKKIMTKLGTMYPSQIEQMKKYYIKFYKGEIP